ncbi:MAG: hypothetical protein FJY75_03350 [Candidatus Eisenbacteria bacterium]|uniref:Metalloprotease TldD/E C-terminal domain-containing protein n=1 Tax=Eiseniibacteriota bacterium TaxID=2212470 RepID=A0A937X6Q1_UNCEI|nr:hypothetical protein [Candidatus Eisenbacteria bacterium]
MMRSLVRLLPPISGILLAVAGLCAAIVPCAAAETLRTPPDLLSVMGAELERSLESFSGAPGAPLYFLQYAVTETHETMLGASDGGLKAPQTTRRRYLDVDLRVGDMHLDNTHEIRGAGWDDSYNRRLIDFPVEDDPAAVRAVLWNETEYRYRRAQERYTRVLANRQVKVEETDLSDDFTPGEPIRDRETFRPTLIDRSYWQGVLSRVGGVLADQDFVIESSATLSLRDRATYMVNSEGSRLEHGQRYLRVGLSVRGLAADGMELDRYAAFDARAPEGLPDEATLLADARRLVGELRALIDAPVVEPYIGPAILRAQACGVFFHEIFGHRIEGHRQKSESEGQTFTKKVSQPILPDFISVYDDPTLERFGAIDLRGHYRYDDEGTPAQRVTVVDRGVLREFLTTRSPIEGFPRSNGHARREHGYAPVSRQGNLIVASERSVPYERLREMLIEECRRQGKPYGLVFESISGGFTMTGRGGPQAFKVLPLYVLRVYTDERPDEVVRGVDIVGTPLTSFNKILMAADDDDVFNGTCGAESGGVPVSAVSPSLLVSEIEVEKRHKSQEKPPILPAVRGLVEPSPGGVAGGGQGSGDPVFRAMEDELDRSLRELVLPDMPRPYFLAYRLQDTETATVSLRYGALVRADTSRSRALAVEVRTGEPAFDNSGFVGSWRDLYDRRRELPDENDYAGLRHRLWLQTDEAYKQALEKLSGKRAYLETRPAQDTIPDFAPAAPWVHAEAPQSLRLDPAAWGQRLREVADVLRECPGLQDWNVTLVARAQNQRYLNSEGSRHLKAARHDQVQIAVTGQAADGQRLTAARQFMVAGGDPLPPVETLRAEARALAEALQAMLRAPALEDYAGPVLFDGDAAAQFIAQLFANQITPPRRPIVTDDWLRQRLGPEPKLAGRLQRRVLPPEITISDDPLRAEWQGRRLAGAMAVDDEGVRGEPIRLVEAGRLLTLPMTRQPTKRIAGSNGRARALPNAWTLPTISNLFVETSDPRPDMLAELRRLAREAGAEYGLWITLLDDPRVTRDGNRLLRFAADEGAGERGLLTAPVVAYKVYAGDDRVEPARGLVFDEVSVRTLRDVAALGADTRVTNLFLATGMLDFAHPATIATPAILVEEMELKAATAREPLPVGRNPIFAGRAHP